MTDEMLTTPGGTPYARRPATTPAVPAVRVYDGGEQYGDRFTVIYPDGDVLGVGATGMAYDGFCQFVGSIHDRGASAVTEGPHLGAHVRFEHLPAAVQRAIIARA